LPDSLEVSETREAADALRDTKPTHRPDNIKRSMRNLSAQLEAGLTKHSNERPLRGGLCPDRHPLLAAVRFLAASRAMADGMCPHGERGAGSARRFGVKASRRPCAEQDGPLQHEYEVPRIYQAVATRAARTIGSAGATWIELANGCTGNQPIGLTGPEALAKQITGVAVRPAGIRFEVKKFAKPLHRVVGEI
jgi:hypothetical protein